MAKDLSTTDIKIKDSFKERYEKLTDWDSFITCSLRFLRRSIRVNTLKISIEGLKKRLEKEWDLTEIPWCKEGFWIRHKNKERRDIGNIPEHSLGYFYIQEAASMIPPLILDPNPEDKVLDMCAAPGSKTTQISMYMDNKGALIANDYTYMRMKSLGLNIQRCGIKNCITTQMEGRWFKGMGFDKILVDAPCSGTGTISKSLKTLRIWNPNMVRRLAGQQRQLLDNAYKNLKKGGTIVYSTCTLEPEEDEKTVSWLLDKYDDIRTVPVKLKGLKTSNPIKEFNKEKFNEGVNNCLRIWPQDNDTEGFFICKIIKDE